MNRNIDFTVDSSLDGVSLRDFLKHKAEISSALISQLKRDPSGIYVNDVKVHITLNILIKDNEFKDAVYLAIDCYNAGADAFIIQDLGLIKYLAENYPKIPIHASTQMTVHNLAGVKQLEAVGIQRVVLARELNINEIKNICKNTSCEIETFLHGALCISYSGQCLFSSIIGGRSRK